MRHHSKTSGLYLVEPRDLQGDRWRDLPAGCPVALLMGVLYWAEHYLCTPHELLGREGPVCPYVRPSLNKDLFWLASHRVATESPAEVDRVMLVYRDWFAELEPASEASSIYKSIVVIFPDLCAEKAPEFIDEVHARLKPEFVKRGLMIGQFHADCPEPGVRNASFRPLRGPVPMLIIREMTKFDLPFVAAPGLVEHYLERFRDDVPERLKHFLHHDGPRRCPFGHESAA
jgi:hypothetical protein